MTCNKIEKDIILKYNIETLISFDSVDWFVVKTLHIYMYRLIQT
mgnify:CR=1 FL=1